MLVSIDHMTLKLQTGMKTSRFCHILRDQYVTLQNLFRRFSTKYFLIVDNAE